MTKRASEMIVDGKGGSDSRTGGVGRIDKIDAAPPVPDREATWVTVLKSFNPLGAAADAYARTLSYRIEVKRLALEAERVEKQAALAEKVIDGHFKLMMEGLEQRRIQLQRFYDTVQKQLGHLHLERMKVLEMAELANRKALADGVPLDERKLYKEMVTELTATIPQFGKQANESLETLVKSLPPVRIPSRLLSSGD
jgi:hypothetical protein